VEWHEDVWNELIEWLNAIRNKEHGEAEYTDRKDVYEYFKNYDRYLDSRVGSIWQFSQEDIEHFKKKGLPIYT